MVVRRLSSLSVAVAWVTVCAACSDPQSLPDEACFTNACQPLDAAEDGTLTGSDATGSGANDWDSAATADVSPEPCKDVWPCAKWSVCDPSAQPPECGCGPGTIAVQLSVGGNKEFSCSLREPVFGSLPLNRVQLVASGKDTVLDKVTGLQWERSPNQTTLTASNAFNRCNELGVGGFNDWRLPTLVELMTLVDFTVANPAIDAKLFPGTKSAKYWTATERPTAGRVSYKWAVDFGNGKPEFIDKTPTHLTRCTRTFQTTGEPVAAAERFVVDSDSGVVVDKYTDLRWQRSFSPKLTGSTGCASFCAGLKTDGGNWLAPDIRQLMTLVDYTRTSPATDPQPFPDVPIDSFWSTTQMVSDQDYSWAVSFGSGGLIPMTHDHVVGSYCRCVKQD